MLATKVGNYEIAKILLERQLNKDLKNVLIYVNFLNEFSAKEILRCIMRLVTVLQKLQIYS